MKAFCLAAVVSTFSWIRDAPGDTIFPIVGYWISISHRGFFGGLNDAEIAESPGEDPQRLRGDQARAQARFRKRLSS